LGLYGDLEAAVREPILTGLEKAGLRLSKAMAA